MQRETGKLAPVPENSELVYKTQPTNRDLLYILEERFGIRDIYQKIGENPKDWIEELGILSTMISGTPLAGGVGFFMPPLDHPDTQQIGEGVYISRSQYRKLRGLWVYTPEKSPEQPSMHDQFSWTLYRTGSTTVIETPKEYADVADQLAPEKFEEISNLVSSGRRPVRNGRVYSNGKYINLFSKGSTVNEARWYEKPKHRLTDIASIDSASPEVELEIFRKLAGRGIATPKFVGSAKSDYEQTVYYEGVEGGSLEDYIETHREQIIIQDSQMLAALSLLGYRKSGFGDFDDKVFDGDNLYLIDADEAQDLYPEYISPTEFKDILADPNDDSKLLEFRNLQREIFEGLLKDAIADYRNTLTPTKQDKELYVRSFFASIGWAVPSEEDIARLTDIPEGYMTHDSFRSMMADDD